MPRMRPRRPISLAVCLCGSLALLAGSRALAQPVRSRVIQGVRAEAVPGADEWIVTIDFAVPVRVVRQDPAERGRVLDIEVDAVGAPAVDRAGVVGRESMRVGGDAPVLEVVYEGRPNGRPIVEVRLTRLLEFQVRPGRNLRTLEVLLREPRRAAPGGDDAAAAWMESARRAMTAGEYDRAIALYTKVLSQPDGPLTAQAQEFLGVAYERVGRRAHAKAEYERYLLRWPDGEGADRVRQRLEALLSAEDGPAEALRPAERDDEDGVDFDWFGSLSTAYVRSEVYPDEFDDEVTASLQLSDLYADARWRMPEWTIGPKLSAHHRYDYEEGSDHGESRVSELVLEAERNDSGPFGALGRQSRVGSGVLGRFDGASGGWRFGDRWRVTAAAGFPLRSTAGNDIDTDRTMTGGSIEWLDALPGLDVELFGNGQWVDGLTDRAAVGAELRYFSEHGSLVGAVDYDVHFASLNSVLGLGNWSLTPTFDVNFLAEYRNSPYLLLSNALQGQGSRSISQLQDRYSDSEIEDLAKDRTPKQTTFTLGGTWRPIENWRFAGDFTASDLEGTDASGGVPGTDGTGWEFAYRVEASREAWLLPGDVTTVGLQFFDGDAWDGVQLFSSARFPVLTDVSLRPRLRLDYRNGQNGAEDLTIAPSTQVDWRIGRFGIDVELGGERLERLGSGSDESEWGWFLDASLRVDF